MASKKFAVYSLADVRAVINNPSVGQCVLSDAGGGKITISYTGDMSSHTTTANGYVVINKMRAKNGTIALELPQNSDADVFMRRWTAYLDNGAAKNFAETTLTVYDNAAARTITAVGVTPQKRPDINYDQTSGTVNYTLLAAEITET